MPFGMRYHPQAIVLNGKVYLGGGKSEKSTQVMMYDPRHELWALLPAYQFELFAMTVVDDQLVLVGGCLLYTSPSPRDATLSRMPSSA